MIFLLEDTRQIFTAPADSFSEDDDDEAVAVEKVLKVDVIVPFVKVAAVDETSDDEIAVAEIALRTGLAAP